MTKIKPRKYCALCGDSGTTLDGQVCSCRANAVNFYESVTCLEIPKQYSGTIFNKLLVPADCGADYPEFLNSVYEKVIAAQWPHKNLVIASPIQHSKTVMAYSCLEMLFRAGLPIFPVYDVLELYHALVDYDMGRKPTSDIEEPQRILSVPVLFAKIPRITKYDVFDAIALLIDRRVRRSNSTILLYDGSWGQLLYSDKNNILKGMMGNGSFGTIEVKSWEAQQTKPEVELQENIG